MQLNKRSVPVRLFYQAQGVWDEFSGGHGLYKHEQRTNLCHMFHVMVLALFASALTAATAGAAIFVLIVNPVRSWGVKPVLVVAGFVLAAAAVLIGILYVFDFIMGKIEARRDARYDREWDEHRNYDEPVEAPEPRSPGLVKLFWTWLVARKKDFCPTVEFVDRISENNNA